MQTQIVDALGDCEFTGHKEHVLSTAAPVVVEYLPAPHSTHNVAPGTTLYVPAAHAVQLPPFGPVYPPLQRQLVESGEPLAD
jgi:hypothetical protein